MLLDAILAKPITKAEEILGKLFLILFIMDFRPKTMTFHILENSNSIYLTSEWVFILEW